MFIKKCWHIIKHDIYELCNDFFNGTVSLHAINSSFITLVRKCNNPTTINDFSPISLLNSILKLITKLLADKLQNILFLSSTGINIVSSRLDQSKTVWPGLLSIFINANNLKGNW